MKRIAVVGWPAVGLCITLFDLFMRLSFGAHLDFAGLPWMLLGWFEWALLAPLVVWLGTTVAWRRNAWLRFVIVHLAGAFAASFAHLTLFALARLAVSGRLEASTRPAAEVLSEWVPLHLTLDLCVYGATLLATQMVLFLRAARRRDDERVALEHSLAQAELDLYKLQLPVDIVNARLLAIEHTIARDAGAAERLIEQFAAFLRRSLAAVRVSVEVDDVARDEDEVEDELPPQLSRPLRLLLLFCILPAAQIVITMFFALASPVEYDGIPWHVVDHTIRFAVLFFPITLAMVWLGSRVRRIALVIAAAALLPFAWQIAMVSTRESWQAARHASLQTNWFVNFLLFLGIALGALAHARYRALREKAVEVARLESRLLRMRALLLRLQLNPHFLFNALNSVAALLEDDPAGAAHMAAQLRRFVARVLESSDRQEESLGAELDALTNYVAIENVRFDGRVKLEVRADSDARRALVPSFVLQPLVENAVRHGLLPAAGGHVAVHAARDGGQLRISVEDDGRSAPRDEPAPEGIGLSNTRARLAGLYGDDFLFDTARRDGGFRVALAIPFRE